MRASAISSGRSDIALAFGLGLGIILGTASLARADSAAPQTSPIAGQLADQSQARSQFTCNVPAGSWCDLRDWSGIDRTAPATEE